MATPTSMTPGVPSTDIVIGGPAIDGSNFSSHGMLSHEIGHCLGLHHTFKGTCGNGVPELVIPDFPNCATVTGDFVCDTHADPVSSPVCYDPISCTWFATMICSCTNLLVDAAGQPYNPDPNQMMAQTPPSCMLNLTLGQGERMRNMIANTPFLQAALNIGGEDLWMEDTPDDLGAEPNPTMGPWWISDDIWVRNTNDGLRGHQNPIASQTNYIYVRIRNRGCDASSGSEELKVYWAKASTALLWDENWVTYTANMAGCSATLFGDLVPGTYTIPSINSGDETVIVVPWTPEDPSNYECFLADKTHFCILARLETLGGMASAENPPFGDIYANTKNNNNIAWKNITVIDMNPGPAVSGYTILRNAYEDTSLVKLFFKIPEDEYSNSFLNYGTIKINLGADLFKIWEDGGSIGEGFELCDDTLLKLTGPVAWIDNMQFDTSEMHVIETIFEQYVKQLDNCNFNFDIEQVDSIIGDTTVLTGGVRFQLNTCFQEEEERKANPFVTNVNKKSEDSHKLYPNPNTGEMQLDYYLNKKEQGEFSIYELTGRKLCSYPLNEGKNTLKINEQSISRGVYFYQMLVDGKRIASAKLIIIK